MGVSCKHLWLKRSEVVDTTPIVFVIQQKAPCTMMQTMFIRLRRNALGQKERLCRIVSRARSPLEEHAGTAVGIETRPATVARSAATSHALLALCCAYKWLSRPFRFRACHIAQSAVEFGLAESPLSCGGRWSAPAMRWSPRALLVASMHLCADFRCVRDL